MPAVGERFDRRAARPDASLWTQHQTSGGTRSDEHPPGRGRPRHRRHQRTTRRCSTPTGEFLSTTWWRCPAGSWRARTPRSRRWPSAMDDVLARDRHRPRDRGRRGRAGHARAGQRRRGHLVEGLDQLLPAGVARLRLPRRAGGARSGCRSSTTTTATRPRSTRTTSTSGPRRPSRSSVSAIVGTGLGGGVIEAGRVVKGAAGMAGELGHVHIPMHGLLARGPAAARCNCGFAGDAESVASLTGIEQQPAAVLAHPVPRARAGQVELDRQGGASWSAATASAATRWR